MTNNNGFLTARNINDDDFTSIVSTDTNYYDMKHQVDDDCSTSQGTGDVVWGDGDVVGGGDVTEVSQ